MGYELEVELTYQGQAIEDKQPFDIELDGLAGSQGRLSERNKLVFLPVLLPEIKKPFTTSAEKLFNMHLNGGRIQFEVTAKQLTNRLPKALKAVKNAPKYARHLNAFVKLAQQWEREGKRVVVEIAA